MHVIPAINAKSFDDAKAQFVKITDIFHGISSEETGGSDQWIHFDVTDGKFTPYFTWGAAEDLNRFPIEDGAVFNFEIHLMVENPEDVVERWLKAGVRRIIVHVEAISDFEFLLRQCESYGASLMVAMNPETPAERVLQYLPRIGFVQVLAVEPGEAGQIFLPSAVEKIKYLRERSHVIIEVDGGINPETARRAKAAGADMLVSASYILNSFDPKKAFETLKGI